MTRRGRPTTNEFIQALVLQTTAVQRLRPPGLRAALWLAAAVAGAAALVFGAIGIATFQADATNLRALVEWFAMLATGIVGITAAHQLAVPGHAQFWRRAAWWPAGLWFMLATTGCLQAAGGPHWTDGADLAHYLECFGFVLGCGVPLSLVAFSSLRRALPLWPVDTAVQACLGVGGLAAALLRFFHPVDLAVIDLLSHFTALALVVGIGALRAPAALLP